MIYLTLSSRLWPSMQDAVSPAWADWDGDGLNDLICGNAKGEVKWFKNIGSKKQVKLTVGGDLLEGSKGKKRSTNTDGPASYLKIDVADYDGDKKLDLIIGANDGKGNPFIWVYKRK